MQTCLSLSTAQGLCHAFNGETIYSPFPEVVVPWCDFHNDLILVMAPPQVPCQGFASGFRTPLMAPIPCRFKLPALGRDSYWERYNRSWGGPWKGMDPPCMGICGKCSEGKQECLLWQSPGPLRELLTHLPDLIFPCVSNYTGYSERGQGQRGPGPFCSPQEVCFLFCLYQNQP